MWLVVALRILHIVAGVFWIGSLFTIAAFVMPAAVAFGPEGQRFLRRLAVQHRLSRAMAGSGVVTVLAGLWLVWIDSGGFQSAWFRTGMGTVLSLGGLAAIGTLAVGIRTGILVHRLDRFARGIEAAGGPPGAEQLAEMQAMGARLKATSRAAMIQGVIAVLCMAAARYVSF
jgi:uncharacterized membrane protein